MSGTSSQTTPTDSTTTVGSSPFSSTMNDPMFQKYLMQLGQGMVNQPTLSQGIQAGLANASGGVISGLVEKQAEAAKIKLEDERQRRLLEALKSYGLGDIGSLTTTLASNPKLGSGLLKGMK